MENVNARKLVFLLILLIVGCKPGVNIEVNVYEVGNKIIYDTLGNTSNETLTLLYTLDSLMGKGESKFGAYSWAKQEDYGAVLTSYSLIFKEEQYVFDFQVYRWGNRIMVFNNPESVNCRLLKNIQCKGANCEEINFNYVLKRIDSITIPPIPEIILDEVLEVDTISINIDDVND